MFWPTRSKEKELLDLGTGFSREEYEECLFQLDQIGSRLGGDNASFKALNNLNFVPTSFLDVGCGGGGFTKKLALAFPQSQVKGIDIAPEAISHAQKYNLSSNACFECKPVEDVPSQSVDVVISTLVCHHLTDVELIAFLRECLRVAKKHVIINDLHRHPCAWLLFKIIAPFSFRNKLIIHDGSLSIKRAFTKKDWQSYFKQLNHKGSLEWHWPFRWLVIFTK